MNFNLHPAVCPAASLGEVESVFFVVVFFFFKVQMIKISPENHLKPFFMDSKRLKNMEGSDVRTWM